MEKDIFNINKNQLSYGRGYTTNTKGSDPGKEK